MKITQYNKRPERVPNPGKLFSFRASEGVGTEGDVGLHELVSRWRSFAIQD